MIRPIAKVAITKVNSGAPTMGRMKARSSRTPNTAAMTSVAGTITA